MLRLAIIVVLGAEPDPDALVRIRREHTLRVVQVRRQQEYQEG